MEKALRAKIIARSALSIRAAHQILMSVLSTFDIIIDLYEGTEGGFTAAVYWCFALLILKDPKVNSSQVKLTPGISLFRDPFSAPVWSSFCKMLAKTNTLQITPGTAPFESFQRCDVIWRRSPTGHTSF